MDGTLDVNLELPQELPLKLPQSMNARPRRLPLWLVSLAGFFILALISAQLPFPQSPLPALWLPAGLALGLFMRHGLAIWPLVCAGSLLAALAQSWFWPLSAQPAEAVIGVTLALITFTEGALGALLLQHARIYRKPLLAHFSSFLWLTGACTAIAFLAALLMTAVLAALTPLPLGFGNLLLSRFLAHLTGMLIIVPLIFTTGLATSLQQLWQRPVEWLLWLAGLVLLALVAHQQQVQVLYLLLLLMIWAATRFSLPGSLLAIALAGLVATAESLFFFNASPMASAISELLLLQALIAVMVGTSTYVRVILEDRRRVEVNLETMIEERTRELQIRNFELNDEIFVREQAEKSFRRSTKHYRALVETASNPIIVIDEDNKVRQWNRAAECLFGYSREEAIGQDLLKAFIPDLRQDEMAWKLTKVQATGELNESIEAEAHSYNGDRHMILWNINSLHEEDEDVAVQLILIGQDITEIRETQDKLHFLAHYDALTGTANRRLFEDRCIQALETALRYGYETALISLDVDHFKRINDSFGHDTGDQLLREIARRLRQGVRREDTISRMGGDEFTILLNRVNGREGAEKVARAILDRITDPIKLPSCELVITSSIGITLAPGDGKHYEELLKNADMAMYRAKSAGRNNIQFFSRDMNAEMQRQVQVEAELRNAIEAGDLHLYYQPVLDSVTGQILALEALLRWHHPDQGVLRPLAFLDVAEQSGQLLQLGEWVCYNACLQARAIQTMMGGTAIPVSINLSSRQFHHPQLCATLARIISETHIGPGMLCIEVDEKTLSEQFSEAPEKLRRLHQIGVKVILDRFGSGLSSIRLLRELPFDQVKIDGALLSGVPQNAAAAEVIKTLLHLAGQMHYPVAISGVETEEQRQFLQNLGCRTLQGHLFSQAIPDGQLAELFAQIRNGRNLAESQQLSLLSPLSH